MRIQRNLLLGITVLVLLVAGVSPGLAVDTVVSSCNDDSALRSAVASGGLITFNCGTATIILTSPLDITAPDTTIDGAGTITLSGGYDGSHTPTQIIRHRSLSTSSTLTLKNMTIRDAKTSGADAASNGGAIWSVFQGSNPAFKPTLNIINVNFTHNISELNAVSGTAYDFGGGAIYSQGGYVNVKNSTFYGNTSSGSGGAIHILRSNLSITNSSFNSNLATDLMTLNSSGGAIYIDGMQQANGAVTINDSTFTNNSTYNEGGAIYIHMYQGADALTVDRSTFSSNSVSSGGSHSQGGAISGGNGKVTITNSLFNSNSVDGGFDRGSSGGAISITQTAAVTIANSTLSYNQATDVRDPSESDVYSLGGALFIVNNTVPFKIINSTIANNYARWAGGGISSSTNGVLQNTILANNTADNGSHGWGILQQCSAKLTNGGGNIQYPDRTSDANDTVCASGITIANPLLQPLNNYYSSVWIRAIPSNSPAIDFGNPTVCAAAPINNLDQRAQSRLVDGDHNGTVACDSGAYEYNDLPLRNYIQTVPNLTWSRLTWAQNYQVQIDNDPAFSSPVLDIVLPASTIAFTPTGLITLNLFFWRVRAQRLDGTWGDWSTTDSFLLDM